jgi:dihydrodipicolinate synthase/N-acetylneuraminate lyase
MSDRIQGILPVVQTPLTEDGQFDIDSLVNEIEFCVNAKAGGVVFPVLASEFMYLTDAERQQLIEVVVKASDGRIPVIAGVAGSVKEIAVQHAKFARSVGADAVIAMPPFIATAFPHEIFDYYEAIAEAAQIPVMIQHAPAGPGIDVAFLKRLLTEVEHIRYIKEEMIPSAHHIEDLITADLDECWGVFGGAWGRWMMSELELGANGFMPSVEIVDIHIQIWDAFQSGDKAKAREIFNQIAPLIHINLNMGVPVVKEILIRRGIIKTNKMRQPGVKLMSDADYRELDAALELVSPLFTAKL